MKGDVYFLGINPGVNPTWGTYVRNIYQKVCLQRFDRLLFVPAEQIRARWIDSPIKHPDSKVDVSTLTVRLDLEGYVDVE